MTTDKGRGGCVCWSTTEASGDDTMTRQTIENKSFGETHLKLDQPRFRTRRQLAGSHIRRSHTTQQQLPVLVVSFSSLNGAVAQRDGVPLLWVRRKERRYIPCMYPFSIRCSYTHTYGDLGACTYPTTQGTHYRGQLFG